MAVWDEMREILVCAPLSGCLAALYLACLPPTPREQALQLFVPSVFSWSSRHVRHRGAAPSLIWIPPRFCVRRPAVCHISDRGRRHVRRLVIRTGVCGRKPVRRADNGSTFSPESRRNRTGPRQCLNFLVWAPWIFKAAPFCFEILRFCFRVGWNSPPAPSLGECVCVCWFVIYLPSRAAVVNVCVEGREAGEFQRVAENIYRLGLEYCSFTTVLLRAAAKISNVVTSARWKWPQFQEYNIPLKY